MSGTPTTHPAWCAPNRCSAPPEVPTEYKHGPMGSHRSEPVAGSFDGVAYLTQAVAPWECSVFLRIEEGGPIPAYSFEMGPDSPLPLLIGQHVADQEARYPTSPMPPHIDGIRGELSGRSTATPERIAELRAAVRGRPWPVPDDVDAAAEVSTAVAESGLSTPYLLHELPMTADDQRMLADLSGKLSADQCRWLISQFLAFYQHGIRQKLGSAGIPPIPDLRRRA